MALFGSQTITPGKLMILKVTQTAASFSGGVLWSAQSASKVPSRRQRIHSRMNTLASVQEEVRSERGQALRAPRLSRGKF